MSLLKPYLTNEHQSCSPGACPVPEVISAASKSMISPSLSVAQAVPSRRRKLAPALSSPPKAVRAVVTDQSRV
jgi:hypothetical protein